MKNLALSALIAIGSFTAVSAQTTPTTAVNNKAKATMTTSNLSDSDFEKLIFNSYKVNFRSYAYDALDLTEKQITKLDPGFRSYMNATSELNKKRKNLVEEYNEEMAEDDTAKDEENETADFIENYWDLDIDQMELKKDYFDNFEDIIGYEKAMKFFILEEDVRQRLNSAMWVEKIPTLLIVPTAKYSNNSEVNNYRNWMLDMDGKVDISHEYTHNGLTQLVKTAYALAEAGNVNTSAWDNSKAMVMKLADGMTENWKSDDHADMAKKAFGIVANMYADLAKTETFRTDSYLINELKMSADKLNKGTHLTEQSAHVYNFFEKAERVVNLLANTADNKVQTQFMRTRR
ncbi:hypothetical protein CEQ90_16940 [Lewinellaceae bacterium SD302]|nr:hypothetical protein CEQ90_16940 [Lewinellaceae bacterium SD302]